MNRLLIASLAFLAPALASADWRMIVHLKPGATLDSAQAAASCLGGTLCDSTPNAPFALFSLPSDPGTFTLAQYAFLSGILDVDWSGDDTTLWSAESVSRGNSLSVIGTHNDLVAMNFNYLQQVDWSTNLANSDGRTVRLAILDNGLSRNQPALWSKVVASYDVFGGSADDVPMGRDSNGDGIPDEGVGHGTMVTGIVNTVAPKLSLLIAKVADSDGRASAWGIVKGLAFAANQGAEIANISLGSEDPVPAFTDAAAWCRTQGLLIVSAIGNFGESPALYPSADSLSICVAGLNADDTKASFSNYDVKTNTCAPAVGLVSQWCDGGLASWSGTSFASPFVAAALADCLRRTSPKTAFQLTNALAQSGRSVDGVNDPGVQGKIGSALDIAQLNARLQSSP